ncbi:hypothetical protein [Clostridium minihomine]|uniref:hypothetical protein n=1 Tax=Clostridium minihomine TaxID=2045012 RepID=UPI000C77A20A|nr:hypothetical protein [Clostridium minihomine]
MKSTVLQNIKNLTELCTSAKLLIAEKQYQQCKQIIAEAMKEYPHDPQPHNLMGILLEQENNHMGAMRHFRSAWALDPAYLPARHNLNYFGSLSRTGTCAYEETDCLPEPGNSFFIRRDQNGILHVTERRV